MSASDNSALAEAQAEARRAEASYAQATSLPLPSDTKLNVGDAYAFQPLAADEDEGAAGSASPDRPRAWWKRPEQRLFRRGIIGLMALAIIGLVVAVVVISGGDASGGGNGPHPSGGGGGGSCLKRDSEFMFWNGMTDSSTWYDWLGKA